MRRSFLAAALALGGCGQSYCERTAERLEDCEDEYEATDEEIEACETQMEPCSASDERKLLAYDDCVADAGGGFCAEDFEDTTPTGTELPDWMQALVTCAGELEGLSQECLGAAGVTTTGT